MKSMVVSLLMEIGSQRLDFTIGMRFHRKQNEYLYKDNDNDQIEYDEGGRNNDSTRPVYRSVSCATLLHAGSVDILQTPVSVAITDSCEPHSPPSCTKLSHLHCLLDQIVFVHFVHI
uniref:Uncharacterized protein n=1 Tax=Cuerna arida TaxID=1464854 RepID=A0A1B6FDK9_9HEMI